MKKFVLCILGIILSYGISFASEDTSLTTLLKKAPNVKTGIAYSIADNKFNFMSTFEVANYKNFNLELGYMADAENTGDKAVVAISYKVASLKDYVTLPILDLIEFNAGAYYGMGNIGGSYEQDYGVSATIINLKF